MDIPVWAEWEGVLTPAGVKQFGKGYKLFLSRSKYVMYKDGEETDRGSNISPLHSWKRCGWDITPVPVCLENK